MKLVKLLVILGLLVGLATTPAYASIFFDNFDDGNMDGWISTGADNNNYLGNWQVSNGILSEDGRDHSKLLVDGLTLSTQSVETKILFHDMGYAGITVWRYDINNWVDVYIYPAAGYMATIEHFDGFYNRYFLPTDPDQNRCYSCWERDRWYTMRVDANSQTGEITTYLDGQFVATHIVATPHRTGLSGLNGGNAGGSFDDFNIISSNEAPIANAGPDQTLIQGEQVTFDGSGSTDTDGQADIVSYSWNFGDGENGIGAVVNHAYINSGVHTAVLTVTDAAGATGSDTVVITVLTPIQAIGDLVDQTEAFNLQQGISNSLDAKLDAAVNSLDDLNENNNVATINSLQAFINSVEAQRGNKITNEQADILVADAQAIINSLSG